MGKDTQGAPMVPVMVYFFKRKKKAVANISKC